jgi:hypothetical protein
MYESRQADNPYRAPEGGAESRVNIPRDLERAGRHWMWVWLFGLSSFTLGMIGIQWVDSQTSGVNLAEVSDQTRLRFRSLEAACGILVVGGLALLIVGVVAWLWTRFRERAKLPR